MKLITFEKNNEQLLGLVKGNEKEVVELRELGVTAKTMIELIKSDTAEKLNELRVMATGFKGEDIENITLCSPIPVPEQDIICLGINYMDHAEESAKFHNEKFEGERPHAVYFSKRVNEAVPQGGFIDSHKEIVDSLDYEVELAVIIGRDAKKVAKEDAYDYVFGYTILNDVSARNLQTKHKQFYFGKSLDGFTPMGPWIVTADEFKNPPILKIEARVNGELRQSSSTDKLIFDIPHVIHELSQGMTLKAGTIISMGTPAGVGMGFKPPKFLKSGDVVECEIEGIGVLKNIVL